MAGSFEERLEALRAKADPEVRRFVEWGATEMHERLRQQIERLGLPPDLAAQTAAQTVRTLIVSVLRTAKRYHELKDVPYKGKPPWM